MQPLISVIIPNRKTEKNESLPSLKKQTYKNLQIIEEIDTEGKGAAFTRNKGLEKAKGEYIFFCDNDLQLEPDCIESLFDALQKNKEADWAFGRFIIDGTEFNRNKGEIPADRNSYEFANYFHGISTMSLIRASAHPRFDEEMIRYDDWDLWITLTLGGHLPVFCDKILFRTKNRPHGISMGNNGAIFQQRLYKKHLSQKFADIVIPHHDQHDLLAGCLKRIPTRNYNIIIVSGGTFAENCNKGARLATTEDIIFLNDDTEPTEAVLRELSEATHDIVGVAQYAPSSGKVFYGINIKENLEKTLTTSIENITVPSGYCFKVKKKAWDDLGGLDEKYKNGGEDVDFFLRAIEKKKTFGYVTTPMTHFLSKSEGRFLYADQAEKRFREQWKNKIPKKTKYTIFSAKESKVFVLSDFIYKGILCKKGDLVEIDFSSIITLQKKGCIA